MSYYSQFKDIEQHFKAHSVSFELFEAKYFVKTPMGKSLELKFKSFYLVED